MCFEHQVYLSLLLFPDPELETKVQRNVSSLGWVYKVPFNSVTTVTATEEHFCWKRNGPVLPIPPFYCNLLLPQHYLQGSFDPLPLPAEGPWAAAGRESRTHPASSNFLVVLGIQPIKPCSPVFWALARRNIPSLCIFVLVGTPCRRHFITWLSLGAVFYIRTETASLCTNNLVFLEGTQDFRLPLWNQSIFNIHFKNLLHHRKTSPVWMLEVASF